MQKAKETSYQINRSSAGEMAVFIVQS